MNQLEQGYHTNMTSYRISWYIPERVLLLKLVGDYSVADAKAANEQITKILDQRDHPLMLLIDASEMERPFNFQRIRALQTYMNHQNLKHIFAISNDKLVTLALMVIFNMGRAYLHLYNNHEEAERAIEVYAERLLD
ncbi:MAG: hypothetical protein CUN55_02360 [Phototrophicales bacterium]|nr:MAG: hypothetical protein CUN55_02360 [Phototrophicales bacterium]